MAKTNVLFVCLGNVNRSPMAEAILKKLTVENGVSDHYQIKSAATSDEELGNPPQIGTRKIMDQHGLSYAGMHSHPIDDNDVNWADLILTMDTSNLADLKSIIPKNQWNKIHLVSDIDPDSKGASVADPWFTHRFSDTYDSLMNYLPDWLAYLEKERK